MLKRLDGIDKRIHLANQDFTAAVRIAVQGEARKPAGSSTDSELP